MKVLVAKCLAGHACRYHGQSTPPRTALLERLQRKYEIVLICPEQLAGLPVPRPPARWRDGRLIANGQDVTELFHGGAARALEIAEQAGAEKFYGLRFSPSCDPKHGITCLLFARAGIKCLLG